MLLSVREQDVLDGPDGVEIARVEGDDCGTEVVGVGANETEGVLTPLTPSEVDSGVEVEADEENGTVE